LDKNPFVLDTTSVRYNVTRNFVTSIWIKTLLQLLHA